MEFEMPGDLVRAYEKRAKKRFGQHFLTDPAILERIVDAGEVSTNSHVLEIGPGPGTLTSMLLARGARVTAIEIDDDAVEFLEEHFVPRGLELLHEDATAIDWSTVAPGADRVVANLPYNVATGLTTGLLESQRFRKMALMYQREVAQRICAKPGSKAFGSLSLVVQIYAKPRIAFTLGPGAFTPPPSVTSAMVTYDVYPEPLIEGVEGRARFETVVRAAFSLRRKTVANSLSSGLSRPKAEVIEALQNAGIEPRRRAEKLSLEQFARLSEALT